MVSPRICRLPNEILFIIIASANDSSLCALRATCKDLAFRLGVAFFTRFPGLFSRSASDGSRRAVELFNRAIGRGINPFQSDRTDQYPPPIHQAAMKGNAVFLHNMLKWPQCKPNSTTARCDSCTSNSFHPLPEDDYGTMCDMYYYTPVHVALHHGHRDAARTIMENGGDGIVDSPWDGSCGPDKDIHPSHSNARMTVLHDMARLVQSDKTLLELIHVMLDIPSVELEQKDYRGLTALALACICANTRWAVALLAKGADINATSPLHPKRTLLHHVLKRLITLGEISQDLRPTSSFVIVQHSGASTTPELIDRLCSAGVDVNARDESGNTALHMAAYMASHMIVETLLECGADPSIRNNEHQVPRDVAKRGVIPRLITEAARSQLTSLLDSSSGWGPEKCKCRCG